MLYGMGWDYWVMLYIGGMIGIKIGKHSSKRQSVTWSQIFYKPHYFRGINRCVRRLKQNSLSLRDYTAQFQLHTSRDSLEENEQMHFGLYMNELH